MRYRQSEAGFSLLELILAVAVMGVLGLGLISVIDEIAKREVARSTAKYMQRASDAAMALLDNPVFFDHFYQDVTEEGGRKIYPLTVVIGHDEPSVDSDDIEYVDLSSGANIVVDVPDSVLLSRNFRTSNPHRAPVQYVFNIPAGSGVGANPRAIEVFVVTTRLIKDEKVRRAASAAGPQGGFFSAIGEADPSDPERLRSAYGVWEVPVANLAGTTWHSDVTNADRPTADVGAYLLHYAYMNEQVSSGDYLYRVDVTNRADLNRMRAPLVMNENSVLGVDNAYVDGTATIATQAIARGSVRTVGATGNLRSYGSMTTDEKLQARSMRVTNNLSQTTRDTYDFNPAFSGANTVEIDTLIASEQIQAQTANLDNVNARSLNADRNMIIGGNLTSNQAGGAVDRGLIDVGQLQTVGAGTTVMTVGNEARMQDVEFKPGVANSLRVNGNRSLGVLTYQNTSSTSQTIIGGQTEAYRANTNEVYINPSQTINCEKGC